MRHLDKLVLKNGLVAAFLCAVLIFGLGLIGSVLQPLKVARTRADKSVEHAVAMLNVEFDRAERTTLGLKALWEQRPVDLKDPTRLASVQPFLDSAGLIMNIILARTDGETLYLVRSPSEWNMILIPGGETHPSVFRSRNGAWVAGEPAMFEHTFQPRQRPWYQLAEKASAPAWTEPYRFTPMSSGFTCVAPVRRAGMLEAVVGVDVTLDHLQRRLQELLPAAEFQTLVTGPGGRVLVPEGPGMSEDPLAREAALLGQAGPERLAAFARPGYFRYERTAALRAQGPSMELRVAVAPGTLVPGLILRITMVVLAALLTFAAVMGYVLYLERNMVRPIRRILGQEAPTPVPSEIWEFRQLEDAILRLGRTETDRQQILNQLEHAQRVETMGNMAPGVIHDLNNHLTVILAQLNMCQEELEGNPRFSARIGKAERATHRCAAAMRGLLEFSRPGAREPVEFALNDLVQATASMLEPVLGEAIRVETTLDEEVPLLQGEPVKLQQVLVNLALNARDAMRGTGILAMRTGADASGAWVEVRDTGCGMTPEVKAKLFDPFFTTKAAGKGTGLGLTMVQRIIIAHGGSIHVDSEPGEGTRILVRLPIPDPCPVV